MWPVEIPEMDYRNKYGPLGYLLVRRNRLEDIAENRRVFYVGCTRTMNHLVLIGHRGKKKSAKERVRLSEGDYRERATIMDLLDDIYEFDGNFSSVRVDAEDAIVIAPDNAVGQGLGRVGITGRDFTYL